MEYSFRLLTFNPTDAINEISRKKDFVVQMFGINELGESASIFVNGYKPFFYVKVGDNWTEADRVGFISQLSTDMGEYHEDSITDSSFAKRKKLYGFDGGKEHTFIMVSFINESAMKKAKQLWYIQGPSKGDDQELSKSGYIFEETPTILYEAHIPPLLRLFHINEISPSGWISIDKKCVTNHAKKQTTCTYEFSVDFKNVISQPDKETLVPYKICSFDIEASSSHGDFPLPVKNYKKLATNIIDICSPDGAYYETSCTEDLLKMLILSSFGLSDDKNQNIDLVYPIKKVSLEQVQSLFNKWIKICPSKYVGETRLNADDIEDTSRYHINQDCELDDDSDDEKLQGEPEPEFNWNMFKPKPQSYKKKGSIVDMLNDVESSRDTLLIELTRTLTDVFPTLNGDKVTFIGSTFIKYGDIKPYLNHCIALNTCDDVTNAVIHRCTSEKEVLLEWSNLIQKENPDIIIGYNIFGFDYNFMYLRAKELKCEREFLQLSRNIKEVCLEKNWKTGKEGLSESTIQLASGQHDLRFPKMKGRLQIDLYNYLRRDYSLSQYKLDYVSGYFIGDGVKKIEHSTTVDTTKIFSKNLSGLENDTYIHFEEESHSVDYYKNGQKFKVHSVDIKNGTFCIDGIETPDIANKKVKWCLAKDDITPQDIFRMTNQGPTERSIIAKYCIQDCNLVHHLMRKIDVMTSYVEMAKLCSIPIEFIVMRGQGIKLTSYIAKKCREKGILIPVINKGNKNEGYEGATVLEPKCNLYLEDPVACLDYSSLYPSAMISENISHDSKVLTKEYNLSGKLVKETGEKNQGGGFIYDNLPGYTYVDIPSDVYTWQRKNNNPKAALEKVKTGYKVCRFAQFPDSMGKGVMPSILEELLAARKSTRRLIVTEKDDFMKNILDKRQLSIKVTANSMYGGSGAKTSSFYELDCAASTTAIGRKLLIYGKRVIEGAYKNRVVPTSSYGMVRTNAEYVYGDTDSVFFKFNLTEVENGTKILGQKALEITIELAQQAGELASRFLKNPHDLEYEKTFMPFCLLSKKRYVGMLYEKDPHKGKRKSMGIVLKRRDNAPIVKDVYGGIIDILMVNKNVENAVAFLKECMQTIVDGKCGMDKLIITKSLRSGYKNPAQIAHKVLADRIGKRDAGNKPNVGDRMPYIYIENPDKTALQGERIETQEFIIKNKLKINYTFYITNQIMKPLLQLFALVLEEMVDFKKKKGVTLRKWRDELSALKREHPDQETYKKKEEALREKETKALLFDEYIRKTNNTNKGQNEITAFFAKCK